MYYVHQSTDQPEQVCQVDAFITGGPSSCRGPYVIHHAIYADTPNTCWCSTLCINHLPWAMMFMADELGEYTRDIIHQWLVPAAMTTQHFYLEKVINLWHLSAP